MKMKMKMSLVPLPNLAYVAIFISVLSVAFPGAVASASMSAGARAK